MDEDRRVPEQAYGVLRKDVFDSEFDEVAEQVRRLGYAVLDAGFSAQELAALADEFERTRADYIARHGAERLTRLDEYHTVRAPLVHGGPCFLQLAFNPRLIAVVQKLIEGQFQLNQQNGVINPPGQRYNQGQWHRDLPYQHFTSSSPLAINALFCLDDFTAANGSTFVLPASHKAEAFPSDDFVRRNALQIVATAGHFVLLDCMTFHSGGFNGSGSERRAVNHVFSIPYLKQQIRLPGTLDPAGLTPLQRQVLGFGNCEPESIDAFLSNREGKAR